jgi:maltooligosyltrehalose trehalohydrolase
VRFRVWAPRARRVELVLEHPASARGRWPLGRTRGGYFERLLTGLQAGARYRYLLDGEGPLPDPASRFQPAGVHGPSEVVDASRFRWSDDRWRGVAPRSLVLYELHVGTFSPAGTFAGVTERLRHLADLGVTCLELMPVADFPGRWNWGYDGVAPFAPSRAYGRPDDLRRLVDRAHALGLGVVLDVVYNHFGPDGAYQGRFSADYFDARRSTPWGAALNVDGPRHRHVRRYFTENALHWLHEYHLDGFRLDATHALSSGGARPFVAELAARLHAATDGRPVLVLAEDRRRWPRLVRLPARGGWGLDGVWADDFHHEVRRRLTGERRGALRRASGTAAGIAAALDGGWVARGAHTGPRPLLRAPSRTTRRLIISLENHDQVGNRAGGERLHRQIAAAASRALSVLLLCSAPTPLLFMGQEWGASTPFLYFTDHERELGRRVARARGRQLRGSAVRAVGPQDPAAFARSRLRWDEVARAMHARTLRLTGALLHLRRVECDASDERGRPARGAWAPDPDSVVVVRPAAHGRCLIVLARLVGQGRVELDPGPLAPRATGWDVLLTTEDPAFVDRRRPIGLTLTADHVMARFERPGAVVLRVRGPCAGRG